MNYEYFIAKRIVKGQTATQKLSGPVIRVAILGIVLGMSVMILSLAIGLGFKKEIRNKVTGFGAHIQILSYDYNQSYETNAIEKNQSLSNEIRAIPGIRHLQPYITKPGLIKTNEAIHGLVLKGVDSTYQWDFFRSILTQGRIPELKDSAASIEILLSAPVARMLQVSAGDDVRMYFIQQTIRARKFKIVGIFDSHFPEFDQLFAIADLRQLQQLNQWSENQISGYEILLNDFDRINPIGEEVHYAASGYIDEKGSMLRSTTILQAQPQIFGWLDLLDTNIVVILVLIVTVAGLNMTTGLLILILERTNMIGLLKAMGSSHASIRKIFIYLAAFIIGKGMLWGNLVGCTLCIVQQKWGWIKLDPENYYLDTVPIYLNPIHLLILNVGAIAITTLLMIAPSFLTSRISPAKAIRFN